MARVPCSLFIFLALVSTAPAAPSAEGPGPGDEVDLVYLGDVRPVLLRLHVQIDGKPFGEAWDAFLAKLFKYLDRDGDGVLNKDEAERAPTGAHLMQLLQGTNGYF